MSLRILISKRSLSLLGLIILFITAFWFRLFMSNLYSVWTEPGYFIPSESNMFEFTVTRMNSGSGDWWVFAKDKTYYYALNNGSDRVYYSLKIENAPADFDLFDYSTWGENIKRQPY